ncbi:hypothetical protein BJ742DRAFT_745177 [Cladochytrium replicatum]|nr:hypothetical protein BJ742DRAFT_745177 [Cladochytrium replicatum]
MGKEFRKIRSSFFWYRKSSELDNADAQVNLGWCLEGGSGIEKDIEKRFIGTETNGGVSTGQYYLRWCYKNRFGVGKDIDMVAHWYTKSSDQGGKDALNLLSKSSKKGSESKKEVVFV